MIGVWTWRFSDLFKDVPPDLALEVLSSVDECHLAKGESFQTRDKFGGYLFVLERGAVQLVYTTSMGTDIVLQEFRAGDVFGELFVSKRSDRTRALALVTCRVYRFNKQHFLVVAQRTPQVALNVAQHFAKEHQRALLRARTLLRQSPRDRLLGTLLTLLGSTAESSNRQVVLPEIMRQEDIAMLAGLNRTTASSVINQLRREKVLGGRGRLITIDLDRFRVALEEVGFGHEAP